MNKKLTTLRTFFLILIMLFLKIEFLKAQTSEKFVHCWGNDSIVIEKISETINGDTIIKEFSHNGVFTLPPNVELKYYHFNDTTFIKYNGEFYMIGADSAEVGDVWNPVRFELNSYTDTTLDCPLNMEIEVLSIDTIFINGLTYRHYSLGHVELHPFVSYKYLEKTGATKGGLYYNFALPINCGVIYDVRFSQFKSYQKDSFTYSELDSCSTVGVNDLLNSNNIKIYPNPVTSSQLTIQSENTLFYHHATIFDIQGRQVFNAAINTNNEKVTLTIQDLSEGMYILQLDTDKGLINKKVQIVR